MQIGAVGGYGMIYQPYIYNTNQITGNSLSKVSAISNDTNTGRTDFSALTGETVNPLKKNQTLHFADVLAMQFQMGQMNAERIMQNVQEQEGAEDASLEMVQDLQNQTNHSYQMSRAIEAYTVNMAI